ncbi:MAG: DNA primase [Mycobacteriales bacterium]
MAGRIRDEDIALVRERSPIATVVGEHLALRNAGGSELKGLCPFHDEKSPSFHVSPQRGYYHCFGCGEGGDVITFVEKVEHLSFTEAVERLAARANIELRYEGGSAAPRQQHGQRTRLVEAHAAAQEFYAGQLTESVEGKIGRDFLTERGFDAAAAAAYSVGYAPSGWDTLVRHLTARGFSRAELTTAGLAREGQRGAIDRFRGRLVWPIRDITGDVIGFGARRLREDDSGPKYLNTPETPLYKKSSVLYGVDLAKKEIARQHQAVIVEGYTDVMACHLSGVATAVATCGTSFGAEHISVLRRLLMDQDEFRGEVVFTFDGDAAGQKAALRAFADDQRFVSQTFVAVEPAGLDPCDLRLAHGDAAVRDLIARRVPLFEFAIKSTLGRHNLEIPEGRVAALAAAAPLVGQIRDRSLRPEYARRLAGWLGMEVEPVMTRVAELAGGSANQPGRAAPVAPAQRRSEGAPSTSSRPRPDDPALWVEREALKIAVQRPTLAGPVFDDLDPDVFTEPAYASVHKAVAGAGGMSGASTGEAWVTRLREEAADDQVRSLVTELAVEPVRSSGEIDARYCDAVLARLQEMAVVRRVTELKSRVQRLNPVEAAEEYNRLFGELIALEALRRGLRERSLGTL